MMKRLNQNTMYRTPAMPPNHNRAVTPASNRTRQRSRSIISELSRRVSVDGACLAMSSCNAQISSFSLILRHSLQRAPQRALGIVNPRPHRAELAAGDAGDVLVGHRLEETQQQYFPMFQCQSSQRRVDALRVFGREVVFLFLSSQVDPF